MTKIWLLCGGLPCLIWLLFLVEIYFITKKNRKNSVLHRIKEGVQIQKNYELIGKANLYGEEINVAIENDVFYFIKNGKALVLKIHDFKSISFKNGKYVFKTHEILWKASAFAIKCNDQNLTVRLSKIIKSFNNEIQIKESTNDDNKKESKNLIANLWNNVGALYTISAILFAVSFIITAIINIGFILVELIGIAFVVIIAIYFNSWKFFSVEDFSKVLFVAIIIGLILMIFALIIEGPNVNIGWQEEWHKCYKCNGSGKVKNDYGWNVTCPRCNGAGGLSY